MLPNFQFSIFNFQSKLKSKFLKFKNSFQISNFKFQIVLIFSFFILSTFYFLSSPTLAKAASQTAPIKTAITVPSNTNPGIPNNLHNWTQNVMIEVMLSLTCQLVGIDPTNPTGQCLGVDQKTGKIGFLPTGNLAKGEIGGAIGGMNNLITALYTPPIRSSDYFQNLAQNFGITKHAYAAQTGTGFEGLKPLLSLWTAFRNIVYLIFVIVFVVIGLAMMLRVKIDPRTVMTIQNQIPKIIIGILLITFSFAIAGFLVDLMWVLTYLLFGLISGISKDIATSVMDLNPTLLQAKNPFEALYGWDIAGMAGSVATHSVATIQKILGISPSFADVSGVIGLSKDIGGLILSLLPGHFPISGGSPVNFIVDLLSSAGSIGLAFKIATLPALNIEGQVLTFGVGSNGGGIVLNWIAALATAGIVYPLIQETLRIAVPYLLVFIIIFVALFMALFKLWFALLMAYISILIDVVLAPFWIIGGLIPGSPISAGGWLKDLSANLLAFPAVIFMLMLGKVFMDSFENATNPFVPPLIGDLGNIKMFGPLIGIGIIMMTPNVVSMIKAAIKAPKTDMGGAMKGLAAGASLPAGAIKSVGGLMTAAKYDISGQNVRPENRFGALVRKAVLGG